MTSKGQISRRKNYFRKREKAIKENKCMLCLKRTRQKNRTCCTICLKKRRIYAKKRMSDLPAKSKVFENSRKIFLLGL